MKEQTEFNLRRWAELSAGSPLGHEVARFEGRIETDRHGKILKFPPADFLHGRYQSEIGFHLKTCLRAGRVVIACPISTDDGVKSTDVAWISNDHLQRIREDICLPQAPEICAEVLSPDNTRREMAEKKALYFVAGAEEVWFCDKTGKMTFHCAPNSEGDAASVKCPAFPRQIAL